MTDDKLTEEQQKALDRFRKKKDDPNSLAIFFYNMMRGADPRFIELMEKKAGILLHAGHIMGKELAAAERDSKKKAEMHKKLQNLAVKINSSVYEKPEKAEEPEKSEKAEEKGE
jgi:hypothetical protein